MAAACSHDRDTGNFVAGDEVMCAHDGAWWPATVKEGPATVKEEPEVTGSQTICVGFLCAPGVPVDVLVTSVRMRSTTLLFKAPFPYPPGGATVLPATGLRRAAAEWYEVGAKDEAAAGATDEAAAGGEVGEKDEAAAGPPEPVPPEPDADAQLPESQNADKEEEYN
jgi:hypothetical protein